VASSRSVIDHLLTQLGREATARPMFGEYGIYLNGTLIGLVCDDRFFLKPTDAGSQVIGEHERDSPYPGAKPAIIVPEDLWEERALLKRLVVTTANALADAPKRTARKSKGTTKKSRSK
jgi:DNA transformation protein